MKVILKKGATTQVSTIVLAFAKDTKSGKPTASKSSAPVQKLVDAAIADAGFTGDKKESCFFRAAHLEGYTNVLLVGLGAADQLTTESFRVVGSVVVGALKSHKVTSAVVSAESVFAHGTDAEGTLQALVEGLELSTYEYTELKSKPADAPKKAGKKSLDEIVIGFNGPIDAGLQKALVRAEILVECQNMVRRLGDAPGNYMTPSILADETVRAAKGTGLKVTVWDKARLKKERFGGVLAVNQGSAEEPRFIVMEYNGGSSKQAPVVFVGKGLTFDCGGISIKPAGAMEEMKYDMQGGAAVIGTMLALAKLKAKVNVVGLVPSTENLIGPAAIKPGDVYTARNGKTVEVFNTDAEGRLILGDALAYGSELKPRAMFDAATLTGAILIALGNTHTGVFTRSVELMSRIQAASDQTGELVWPMPLVDFHVEDMKGLHADLCNISSGRLAGSSTAAGFLSEFVGKGHSLGALRHRGYGVEHHLALSYHPRKGASGIIMRTFVALAESYVGKMSRRILAVVGPIALTIALGSWWAVRRRAGAGASAAVQICTHDIYKLFRENSTSPLSEANARSRCECIDRELSKTDEGREILRLIVEHKKFLQIIESGASHASAFEAMGTCNR